MTFPFFFGVMFGDIGHGLILFCIGLYLVFKDDEIRKGSLKMFSGLRYMIVMMGFFAVYCGFIYNDVIGFNVNLFGSCYDPPAHPSEEDERVGMPIYPRDPDCVYPMGIDPVWGRAENNLVFVNSLKMKLSVIIAIIHMTLGVCCKAANAIFYKDKLVLYYEFIPQFIFLVGLFGYMDFLIIFKWLKPWDTWYDNKTPPQQWAPSIITTMMNIGLAPGHTVKFALSLVTDPDWWQRDVGHPGRELPGCATLDPAGSGVRVHSLDAAAEAHHRDQEDEQGEESGPAGFGGGNRRGALAQAEAERLLGEELGG